MDFTNNVIIRKDEDLKDLVFWRGRWGCWH